MSDAPKISAVAVTARILAARLDGVAADIRTARWALHANLGLASVAKMEEWADEISTEAVYLWKYAAENEAVSEPTPSPAETIEQQEARHKSYIRAARAEAMEREAATGERWNTGGRCPECEGSKLLNLSLDGRSGPDIPCPDCNGTGTACATREEP